MSTPTNYTIAKQSKYIADNADGVDDHLVMVDRDLRNLFSVAQKKNLTYNLPILSTNSNISLQYGGSLVTASNILQFSGDITSPSNLQVYGTNSVGVKGWYAQSSITTSNVSFSAGSVVFAQSLTETTTSNQAYQKAKEILVGTSGTITYSFDMKSSTGYIVYGQVYKNGSSIGSEQNSISQTYATYTENINVSAGDLVQLYIKGSINIPICLVKNFLLQCANFFGGYVRISTVGGSVINETP